MRHLLTLRVKILLGLVLAASTLLFQDLLPSAKRPVHPLPSKAPVAKPSPEDAAIKPPVSGLQSPVRPTLPVVPVQPWMRDPFAVNPRRLLAGVQGLQELKVSGIVWGPNGYKALINDSVVTPGDKVEGALIMQITSKGVVVEKEGQVHFLPLAQEGKVP